MFKMGRKMLYIGILIIVASLIIIIMLATSHKENSVNIPPGLTLEEKALKKLHHRPDGAFSNPWITVARHGTFDFFKWQFSKKPYEDEKKKPFTLTTSKPDFAALEKSPGDYFIWLGHSTIFMRVGDKHIITDPVFYNVTFFVKRKTPLPIEPDELPGVDYVFISHGHYDHLNTASVKFLIKKFDPYFITGPGYKKYFSSLGSKKNTVVDWYENFSADGFKITALPVQHWSKRSLFDSNRMLWQSFLIETIKGKKYYWIGDTGYFDGYREIGSKFGPIDVLFAPIGAYEPRWFMRPYHLNPEETYLIATELKALNLVPIHYGTFDLTDEPLTQPSERVKEAFSKGSSPKLNLITPGSVFRP